MNWSMFFKVLLRNIVLAMFVSSFLLSAIGYMLAGRIGLENGLGWGIILGFVGGLMSAVGMIYPIFWGGYASRYGKEQYRQASEGEDRWPSKNLKP